MIRDWQTDRVYFSDLLPARHPALWEELVGVLRQAGIEHHLIGGTHDIWVRDFMPVQVCADDFVLFRYQPDYLCGHEDLITPDAARSQTPPGGRLRTSDINLDGGNVVAGSDKVILTDRVYCENPETGVRQALRQELARFLRAECVFIPQEPDDVIGHADGVVRFLDEDMVVVNDYRQVEPGYGEQIQSILREHDLCVEEVPYFCTEEVVDGIPSAVGNYVNFLRVGGLVVMPAYGRRQDELACRTLQRLLPGVRVVPLRCEGLAREGGVLNCVSWTIEAEGRTKPTDPATIE